MKPSDFWQEWSTRDRGLALALDVYEHDVLGPNGFPCEIEEDPDNDGYFKVEEAVNYASRALDLYREHTKPEPGAVFRIVFDKPSEEELNGYR